MIKIFSLGCANINHRVPRITFVGVGQMLYFSSDFGLFIKKAKIKIFFRWCANIRRVKSVANIFMVMARNYWIESWNDLTDIRSYTLKKARLKFTIYSST